jgi:hypothetical protein
MTRKNLAAYSHVAQKQMVDSVSKLQYHSRHFSITVELHEHYYLINVYDHATKQVVECKKVEPALWQDMLNVLSEVKTQFNYMKEKHVLDYDNKWGK